MNQLELQRAIASEGQKFQECYLWLERSMPPSFFKEISNESMMLITHNLMGFDLQDYYCTINLKNAAIVMCLDSSDADLRMLENYTSYGIRNYISFVSLTPPPFLGVVSLLRIGLIYFTESIQLDEKSLPIESLNELYVHLKKRIPKLTEAEFDHLIHGIKTPFLKTLNFDSLLLALEMFFRARTRDNCQYEIRQNPEWASNSNPSLEIVLAWRNTPKHIFLYRLALMIHRYGLVIRRVNATYVDPYSKDAILIMVLDLHGADGEAAWEAAPLPEFLRELATIKYFSGFDTLEEKLVDRNFITGLEANLLRAMVHFIHQTLVHIDSNIYTLENIREAFTRQPDLTVDFCNCFRLKFHPQEHDFLKYEKLKVKLVQDVSKLDTGNEEIDTRRKNVLLQGINMLTYTLKTNFYQTNYTSIGFRLDPQYLDQVPFDRTFKFPVLPYAIFFVKGMHFFGFHIRFKDLARGGLRTVFPERAEQVYAYRNQIFTECYNLALTQQNKNKDIPEGGAKGIIFLKPDDQISSEISILRRELEAEKIPSEIIDEKLDTFTREQKIEYLHHAQRSFVENLLTLVNCTPDGKLKSKYVVDYLKKPEYLYLGPDENMDNSIIQWIADTSKKRGYRPGSAFISSKPLAGINHKEYGVTSLGLNVYVEQLLKYAGIDPSTENFTVKMSGGPDGDVAGNQIKIFYEKYPKTAKILALTDVSGTLFDPDGVDLKVMANLFEEKKPLRFYPPQFLNDGGFILDRESKRQDSALSVQTLMWKKTGGEVSAEWLSGSDMNHILKTNVHDTIADIFIPAGGRPRTLNESNFQDFLDETGKPTSRLIVEGANLYITPGAREKLEGLGCLIIKDSSANKTGVICSSFEVLTGLAIGDELFLEYKEELVKEILERLKQFAFCEAQLLIHTHRETGMHMTSISSKISERINLFNDQIMNYLEKIDLSHDIHDPLISCFLSYCLKTLRDKFTPELIREIPEIHKKAVISAHISAELVYRKGLNWFPSIVDILPLALKEIALNKQEC